MTYQLPSPPPFPAGIYAQDRVAIASAFRRDVIDRYIANYESFWAIGRSEVGMAEMQSILDALGATGLLILNDSAAYVAGIIASFPSELPEKYHSTPYTYTIEAPGRLVLGELKPAWIQE